MDDILNDDRFKHIATDPKFKKVPKTQRKVKIDKRFQSIFSDKRFQVNYTVDKRGRPVNQSSSENFRKYYDLSSDEDNDDDDGADSENVETDEETDDKLDKISKSERISKKKKDINTLNEKKKHILIEKGEDRFSSNKTKSVQNRPKHTHVELEGSDSEEDDDLLKAEAVSDEQLSSQLDSVKKRSKLPEEIKQKLHDLNVDYARGMGALMTDSSSDEATDEDSEEESKEEIEHDWGELDKDADTTDTATHRLAICNMDWDRIRAVDLMVLCSSFLPSGGHIKSITIYPSEFGLKRMKEEELKGPIELVSEKVETNIDNDDDNNVNEDDDNQDDSDNEEGKEGSSYHMERLRQYQLNRLKYYYAVVECDSAETASKLYSECDGMEYESSATKLDLRFIPNDVTFDEEPKEVCTGVQDVSKYEPRFFVNSALQQGKVTCTWDETDPARTQLAEKLCQMKGGPDNLDDEQLQMFLASSSDDDNNEDDVDNDKADNDKINKSKNDGNSSDYNSSDESDEEDTDDKKVNGTSKSIEKYRNLLSKIQESEEKKKNRDVEMEITWGVGLKEKAQSLVDKKLKEKAELTPFELMIEKKREKLRQKRVVKAKKKKGEGASDDSSRGEDDDNVPFSDDDIPNDVDLNDDYFKEEFGDKVSSKNNKKKKTKKGNDNDVDEKEKQKMEELELLVNDDEIEEHKRHFSLKKIQESEQGNSRKRKKGRKQIIKNNKNQIKGSNDVDDDFQVDVNDSRFGAVFSSHHFNIDPADPHFRKTKGMDAFVKEKINRKYSDISSQDGGNIEYQVPSKQQKLDSDLTNVVSSIKKKTKGLK